MKIKPFLSVLSSAILCATLSYAVTALAQQPPERPHISAEKMEAIRTCAAAKGVELPAPPPKGEKPSGPPPEGGKDGKGPPKLTDEQRAIVDACFKENGVEPPKPHGPPPEKK